MTVGVRAPGLYFWTPGCQNHKLAHQAWVCQLPCPGPSLPVNPGTVSSREAGDCLRGHLITPRRPQMPRLCMEGATMGPRSHKLAGVSLWAWTPGRHMLGLPGSCGREIIGTRQSHREHLHQTFSGSFPSPQPPPSTPPAQSMCTKHPETCSEL